MKVYVTVGSMLPFERLIKAMDQWARQHPDVEVVAQTGGGSYVPTAMKHQAMVAPDAYRRHCAEADVIVSHVGMGTVITAAEVGKPLVALPRRRDLQEVTSDHQIATAKWLRQKPGVEVVDDEAQLGAAIERMLGGPAVEDFGAASREKLVSCVKAFLDDAVTRR
jgi:UDP-N-acetylglucosamine transferase subunit ALG13